MREDLTEADNSQRRRLNSSLLQCAAHDEVYTGTGCTTAPVVQWLKVCFFVLIAEPNEAKILLVGVFFFFFFNLDFSRSLGSSSWTSYVQEQLPEVNLAMLQFETLLVTPFFFLNKSLKKTRWWGSITSRHSTLLEELIYVPQIGRDPNYSVKFRAQ